MHFRVCALDNRNFAVRTYGTVISVIATLSIQEIVKPIARYPLFN